MRYREVKIDGKVLSGEGKIAAELASRGLYWLIDSEVEDAEIEICGGTVIWHSGEFLSGRWHYGIFKGGDFHGVWENGIFERGNMSGRWVSGIDLRA